MAQVGKWLLNSFGKGFKDEGDALEHSVQTDVHSCSVCAESTIATAAFGDPLWKQSEAATQRLRWFCLLSKACINAGNVSISPLTMEMLFYLPSFI